MCGWRGPWLSPLVERCAHHALRRRPQDDETFRHRLHTRRTAVVYAEIFRLGDAQILAVHEADHAMEFSVLRLFRPTNSQELALERGAHLPFEAIDRAQD